jgi:hypothetical protein
LQEVRYTTWPSPGCGQFCASRKLHSASLCLFGRPAGPAKGLEKGVEEHQDSFVLQAHGVGLSAQRYHVDQPRTQTKGRGTPVTACTAGQAGRPRPCQLDLGGPGWTWVERGGGGKPGAPEPPQRGALPASGWCKRAFVNATRLSKRLF